MYLNPWHLRPKSDCPVSPNQLVNWLRIFGKQANVPIWQTNTKRSIGGGPGVGSGVVVVGTREGKVLALSPVTGEVLWKAQVMVTLAAFTSREEAEATKANLPDSLIPDSVLKQLGDSPDPRQTGIKICNDMLHEIREIPGMSGANLLVLEGPLATIETISQFQSS